MDHLVAIHDPDLTFEVPFADRREILITFEPRVGAQNAWWLRNYTILGCYWYEVDPNILETVVARLKTHARFSETRRTVNNLPILTFNTTETE